MAKRIMRQFKIDEISGVDRPAQEHAKMVIMKRDFTADERQAMADKGEAMSDGSYPIANTADLENAIQAFGRAKDKAGTKAHIITRAKALGASDKLPADWTTDTAKVAKDLYGIMSSSDNSPGAKSFTDLITQNEECRRQSAVSQELWPYFDALSDSIRSIVADQTMDEPGKINAIRQSIDQFTTAVTEAIPDAEAEIEKLFTDPAASGVFLAGNQAGDHVSKKETPMSDDTKKVADLEKAVSDLTTANATLTKAKDEAEAKVTDLTKAADIAKNDEVLKVGETEVRKSAVGEASFAFMKAQQAEIAKARDETEMERLTKRATDELGQLPGEPIAKAKALKAVNGMPAEEKATIETMLKAGRDAIAKGFQKFGVISGGANADDPLAKLDTLAKSLAVKDSIPFAKAYDAVLKTEEGSRLYNESRKSA